MLADNFFLGNMKIIQRTKEDELGLVELEESVTNKWRWEWLEKLLVLDLAKLFPSLNWTGGPITVVAKDYMHKVDEPGKATCAVCKGVLVNYSKAGLKSITP